jgi:phage FluMu gp28-like protein
MPTQKRTRKSQSSKKKGTSTSLPGSAKSTVLMCEPEVKEDSLTTAPLPQAVTETEHALQPTVEILPPEKPRSPLYLYPYQVDWINDQSRLKIADKARRIGFSFAAGFAGVLDCLESKRNFIVLSRGERQSKEFISESVAPHVRAAGAIADYFNEPFEGSSIFKKEVRFGNGSRIIALPANPETARSYEGDILLDEFAFHLDARRIYEAIAPSIARGYKLSIISTPNGQQGTYYELSKEAGLVDGNVGTKRWSPHKCDIFEAIKQGCSDRFGNPLDAGTLRGDCLDEEMWLQEYCCAFLSIASQWIPPELFAANLSADASLGDADGEPLPEYHGLYAGWDIARNKDLSVVWLMQPVGDVSWTRGVMEMRNVPTPEQVRKVSALMPRIRRLCIDKSGMGLSMFETLEEKYGSSRVEGIQFTLPNKEALATHGKRRMEEFKVRIPESDMIRHSFRAVKKTVTATGQARFDAEHDEKYGHSDHWWSFCLAESAGHNPGDGFMRWLQTKSDDAKRLVPPPSPQDIGGGLILGSAMVTVPAVVPGIVTVNAAETVPSEEPREQVKPFTDPYGLLKRAARPK